MGQTEVTQAQWEFVMGFLPDLEITFGEGDNHPVYFVSWLECQDFLVALNGLSGEGTFRLPTEAEWEYACRAGTTKRFYFGNSLGCDDECEDCEAEEEVIGGGKSLPWESTASPLEFEPNLPLPFNLLRSDFMWFCPNSGGDSQRVRSLRPNAFGLYDMSGNVREWCQDLHHDNYSGAPNDGSAWVSGEGIQRVVRGGSRGNFARSCRSAYRVQGFNPSSKFLDTGFRLVWTP
jgi:formylglycine-generating enzyme required for sulfatase activity